MLERPLERALPACRPALVHTRLADQAPGFGKALLVADLLEQRDRPLRLGRDLLDAHLRLGDEPDVGAAEAGAALDGPLAGRKGASSASA